MRYTATTSGRHGYITALRRVGPNRREQRVQIEQRDNFPTDLEHPADIRRTRTVRHQTIAAARPVHREVRVHRKRHERVTQPRTALRDHASPALFGVVVIARATK